MTYLQEFKGRGATTKKESLIGRRKRRRRRKKKTEHIGQDLGLVNCLKFLNKSGKHEGGTENSLRG